VAATGHPADHRRSPGLLRSDQRGLALAAKPRSRAALTVTGAADWSTSGAALSWLGAHLPSQFGALMAIVPSVRISYDSMES